MEDDPLALPLTLPCGVTLPNRIAKAAMTEGLADPLDDGDIATIRQALLDLPEHLRIVFMLAVIEDLKYREIADILECPVGTVMSRLFRARAMLRQRLEQFADEAGYVAE